MSVPEPLHSTTIHLHHVVAPRASPPHAWVAQVCRPIAEVSKSEAVSGLLGAESGCGASSASRQPNERSRGRCVRSCRGPNEATAIEAKAAPDEARTRRVAPGSGVGGSVPGAVGEQAARAVRVCNLCMPKQRPSYEAAIRAAERLRSATRAAICFYARRACTRERGGRVGCGCWCWAGSALWENVHADADDPDGRCRYVVYEPDH